MRASYSQISRAGQCLRLYAFGACDKIYAPQKKQGTDGDELHAINEGHVKYGLDFPDTPMGRLARLGADHLPTRADMPEVEFEGEFAYGKHTLSARADLLWLAPCGPVVGDYKTCEHFGFALTPTKLRMDLQAVINCYYAMEKYRCDEATALWLYYRRPDARKAGDEGEVRPVETVIDRDGALRVLRDKYGLLNQMSALKISRTPALQVVGNPSACSGFGGCWYRHLCFPQDYVLSDDGKKSVERGPIVEVRHVRA